MAVRLTSVLGKLVESIVKDGIVRHNEEQALITLKDRKKWQDEGFKRLYAARCGESGCSLGEMALQATTGPRQGLIGSEGQGFPMPALL